MTEQIQSLNLGWLTIGEIYDHGWVRAVENRPYNEKNKKLDPQEVVLAIPIVRLAICHYPDTYYKEITAADPVGFRRAELAEAIAHFQLERGNDEDDYNQFSTRNGTLANERSIDVDWDHTPPVVYSTLDY